MKIRPTKFMGFHGVFMAPTYPLQTQGKQCKIKRFYSTPVGIKKTSAEGPGLAQAINHP